MTNILQGDAAEQLAKLDSDSFDALVTDPPAGIGFMGKAWDGDKGGRNQWIAWLCGVMTECKRTLKPGAHALVWALPRTSHWTATALEDAGFEIRDVITHHFGSGFPKSLDVDKAISPDGKHISIPEHGLDVFGHEGQGTALKPASEHWILCRKPLDGTVAGNVLEHGTGGINVDGCRVDSGARVKIKPLGKTGQVYGSGLEGGTGDGTTAQGRWPTNLLLTHSARCADAECVSCCPVFQIGDQSGESTSGFMAAGTRRSNANGYKGAMPDQTAKDTIADTGTAARFFPTFNYEPKPSTAEREQGCTGPKRTAGELTDRKEGTAGLKNPRAGAGRTSSGRANHHPTVKPIALMQWLCRLITPSGGTVLDPFCGSGTTGIAALREGFQFVGIELNSKYAKIARDRIIGDAPLFNRVS